MKSLLLLALIGFVAATRYDGYKVLKVFPTSQEHAELLHEWDSKPYGIDLWMEPSIANRPVKMHVPGESLPSVMVTLDQAGMHYEVVAENLQELIDENLRQNAEARARAGDQYHFTEYRTLAEIDTWVQQRISNCPSGLTCERISFGNSHEGRAMYGAKFSAGSGRRAFWYDAGIHAREWISPATGMWIMNELLNEYAANDAVTHSFFDRWDFYFLPVMNPDGYVYSHDEIDGDRMWRKTRTEDDFTGCYGVDANRNFGFHWMTIGASDDPCSNTYAGPDPYSEPCVRNVRDYVVNQQSSQEFEVFLTTHSFGQLFLLPYGYRIEEPHNYDELMRVAEAGANALFDVHGTLYRWDSASVILYPSSGTSRDWAHGNTAEGGAGMTYVYTFELRDTGDWGFLLPPEQIIPTGQETWAGVKEMARQIIAGPGK